MKRIMFILAILPFCMNSAFAGAQDKGYEETIEEAFVMAEVLNLEAEIGKSYQLLLKLEGLEMKGKEGVELHRAKRTVLVSIVASIYGLGDHIEAFKKRKRYSESFYRFIDKAYDEEGVFSFPNDGKFYIELVEKLKEWEKAEWGIKLDKDKVGRYLATYLAYGNPYSVGKAKDIKASDKLKESRQKCSTPLSLDLARGTLDGVTPSISQQEAKKLFPCYTGSTEDGEVWNYGGGVFYKDHDLYIHTHKDFFEVRGGFAGTITPPVMSADISTLDKTLGFRVSSHGNDKRQLYKMDYGCLRVDTINSTVVEIGVHYKSCDEVATLYDK